MSFLKKYLRPFGAVLTAAMLLGTGAEARELRVSVFEPPQGFYPVHIFQSWIDKVNPQLSEGTSLRMFPGAMLGSPVAQRDLVVSGAADIALVIPTYTPGIFPATSVVEVPFIANNSVEGAKVLNTLLEEGALAGEYKDFKVIGLFSTPAYNVISTRDGMKLPADVAGSRMRVPSSFMSRLFTDIGASGVSLPATQVYESLDRKVIDATMWNYNASATFRLYEPAPYSTVTRLGVTPVAILMNKRVYDGLDAADRAVFDANSGRAFSEWAGEVSDRYEEDMRQRFLKDGSVKEHIPTEAEMAEWRKAVEGSGNIWLTETAGLDRAAGEKILARARELSAAK